MFYSRKMLPDLIMRHKDTGKLVVFDAKFKEMRLKKESVKKSDLDRADFFQIHTYIQHYQPDVVLGGLLYPLSEDLDAALAHSDYLFGNENIQTKFIVDGIYVNEGMRMDEIIEKEMEFLQRMENLLNKAVSTED